MILSTLLGCSSSEQPSAVPAPVQPRDPPRVDPVEVLFPPITAPVVVPPATAAHVTVQRRMHGSRLADHPLVHFVPVEDVDGRSLQSFHRALRQLQAGGDPDGKVRVAFYGSSSVAADRYSAYLRGYLQHRFGDGGVGFVALVPLWRWHRHNAVAVEARGPWQIEHAQKKTGHLDGYYGLLGASASSDSKAARLTLEASGRGAHTDVATSAWVELFFLQQPHGGRFTLALRGATPTTLNTAAPSFAPGYHRVELSKASLPLNLRVKGDGEVRLFGAVFERETPGVVVDTLGIGGTRAANHVDWNEDMWADHVLRRAPDLYVLAYGANEAVDEDEPIELYRDNLSTVLDRFARVLPHASCLLVGPVDFPQQDEDTQWVPRPRIDAIIDAQREIATVKGCGFWDTRRFMGGPGSMDAWSSTDPALAKGDHLHYTTLGYLHLGRTFTDALMARYDTWEGE